MGLWGMLEGDSWALRNGRMSPFSNHDSHGHAECARERPCGEPRCAARRRRDLEDVGRVLPDRSWRRLRVLLHGIVGGQGLVTSSASHEASGPLDEPALLRGLTSPLSALYVR